MANRLACTYCEVCSRKDNLVKEVKKATAVVPTPAPVPPNTSKSLASWFTQDLWDRIFPYADCSAVYCPTDGKPFWTRNDFIAAVQWLESLPNKTFTGFGSSSTLSINMYEVASFLGNFQQECSDPSILAPYPWLYPKADPQSGPEVGPAGGGLCVVEGLAPIVVPHKVGTKPPFTGVLSVTLNNMRPTARKVIGLRSDDILSCVVQSYTSANQPNFGLGMGTGTGAVFQPGLAAVSDDGTLFGNASRSIKDNVRPQSELSVSTTDRKYACKGTYCQYGGRGAIQLSYNFNYSDCSIDLFKDYRLCRYPNLLITTDRETWCGLPQVFGFPGPNADGKNKLPTDIDKTTPSARILAWATCIWFWMIPRSGRAISCHQCMLEPEKYGITGVNLIVNNQSGLVAGTWAAKKIEYYKRICAIMGLDVGKTIVSPPGLK